MDPEIAADAARELTESGVDSAGFTMTDDILLLFAAMSEDYAQRIVRWMPHLADRVKVIRDDPAAFLAQMKADWQG